MIKNVVRCIAIAGYFLDVHGLTKTKFKNKDSAKAILPEKAEGESISQSGVIALSVAGFVAFLVLCCCLVKRYCSSKRETAVVNIGSQRNGETTEFSWCNDSPPPPYPGFAVSESTAPPRYSTLFDEHGRERVTPPSLV